MVIIGIELAEAAQSEQTFYSHPPADAQCAHNSRKYKHKQETPEMRQAGPTAPAARGEINFTPGALLLCSLGLFGQPRLPPGTFLRLANGVFLPRGDLVSAPPVESVSPLSHLNVLSVSVKAEHLTPRRQTMQVFCNGFFVTAL